MINTQLLAFVSHLCGETSTWQLILKIYEFDFYASLWLTLKYVSLYTYYDIAASNLVSLAQAPPGQPDIKLKTKISADCVKVVFSFQYG